MTGEPARTADGRHVLVIEDEPQMRAMLTDNLEFEGYRVTAVASGEDALEASIAHAFSFCWWTSCCPASAASRCAIVCGSAARTCRSSS